MENENVVTYRCEYLSGINKSTPLRSSMLVFIYVKQGGVSVEINYQMHRVKAPALIAVLPLDIVTLKESVDDAQAHILALPMSFLDYMKLDRNLLLLEQIKRIPILDLSADDVEIVDNLFGTLNSIHKKMDYYSFEDFSRGVISVLFGIFKKEADERDIKNNKHLGYETRKKTLFKRFLKELVNSRTKSREVLYYANELGVSSGYLNEVANEVANHSAKDIIDKAVASSLKYELSYTDKSIQELADEYNFPSQSYLSRYYKRITGMSPSDFRKNRGKEFI